MPKDSVLFLDLARFEDGKALRGGALVTDSATEPLEFRCTTAVRPTALQKILWGTRLSEHIAANLLGKPLTGSLDHEYGLIAIREPDFLELRDAVSVPMVRLMKHAQVDFDLPEATGSNPSAEDAAFEGMSLLDSGSGRFEPVVLQCHRRYPQDMSAGREILQPIFQARDVVEPFERIQAALEAVHEEERKKG